MKCEKGHIFKSTQRVFLKNWCPECAGVRYQFHNLLEIARSGICLSKEYINNRTNYFSCKCGNQFYSSRGQIKIKINSVLFAGKK